MQLVKSVASVSSSVYVLLSFNDKESAIWRRSQSRAPVYKLAWPNADVSRDESRADRRCTVTDDYRYCRCRSSEMIVGRGTMHSSVRAMITRLWLDICATITDPQL